MNRYAVVLAAGQGTRMKSKLYKVMHPVMGKPMVGHVVDETKEANVDQVVTVTGVGAEVVKDFLGDKSDYVLQEKQLGTAHAVMQARDLLENKEGTTLVICGDTPLLTSETLESLLDFHNEQNSKGTILTAHADNPKGYGRIIRADDGTVSKIVEQKDASKEEQTVQEINTGTYWFDNKALFDVLSKVDNENAQGEYYLPDVIEILKKQEELVTAFQLDSMDEALGVNDRVALSEANRSMKNRINERHMHNGVSIIDPSNTYIESGVQIGADTIVEPGAYIKGNTVIGKNAVIGAQSIIIDSKIADGAEIKQSRIEKAEVGRNSDVGPYSQLRSGAVLKENVHVGDFVEIKKSTIGNNSKAGHHAYIGDAKVGTNVNIGCGVIFVNYDGKDKHQSIIEDNVFIGSNSNIIAPAHIEDSAFVAAGSTITESIPENGLGIARARQVVKEGYANKLPYNQK